MNILKIWTKILIFRKFGLKKIFLKILYHIRDFRKINGIFEYFDQTQDFLKKISTKIEIFFLKFSTQIEIFRKFRPKSWFFENFDYNSDFSKIPTKIKIFGEFWPESRLLKNYDKNRDFLKFRKEDEDFPKFRLNSAFFENFDLNWHFSKISKKSRFGFVQAHFDVAI